MPIYEYQCLDCKHEFETMQKASDPPEKKCPKCGGRLSKVISAPALQFKGGGWYITDYARKSEGAKGAKESKDKGAEDAPKKTEEKKSEPSPAAKKD
ncbi:MAG: zinc ribbon domain-containing protein [Candidatus Aminicenantes bacterium]|nr:zinc ribbon domain-containing protein [Candidatus Aminicenantes bacterium]